MSCVSTPIASAIDAAFALLPDRMDTRAARVALIAIGLQESGLKDRCQKLQNGGRGPAHGLWQFERTGGVLGVLTHGTTRRYSFDACKARGIAADSSAVWIALEHDDVLAAVFARLLLWSDAKPLPAVDDVEGMWRAYALRTWRPGKPHHETWAANHAAARASVGV